MIHHPQWSRKNMLTTKFDILKKNQSILFAKPEYLVFTVIRWSIFLNGGQLYIFHKLDHRVMFSRLCTYFLDNFVEFHSKNKKVFQTKRRWTQIEDFKPPWWSPRRDDQNRYMDCMIWNLDKEVMIFQKCSNYKTGGSDFNGSDLNLSRDFHHIWLGFFNSWKEQCPAAYIYIGHGRL
jgi:hypothetical protein